MENTQEKVYTVEFRTHERGCEMSSNSSAPSLTVYRPERDHFQSKEQFKVNPGYINASSFRIKNAQDARDFEATLSEGIRLLNEYNSVVEGWEPVVNPWEEMRRLQERVAQLETEEGAKRIITRIKEAKKAIA